MAAQAQSSPVKLLRKKTSSYSTCLLSDVNLARRLLDGVSIATCNPSVEDDEPLETDDAFCAGGRVPEESVTHTVSTRTSCGCCGLEFACHKQQRAHFKSDWHRYNLKQQLKGENSISEEAFEALSGDVSSISGSGDSSDSSSDTEDTAKPAAVPARLKKAAAYDGTDSESEGGSTVLAATRKHPKLFLKNNSGQLVSLYRCLLYHKKNAPTTQADLLDLAGQALNYTRVAVIMLAGGHFAAAVFDGKEAVVHKTFHRYVVRAKRGTVQSVRDNQGSAPKSGGASLRRYNEAALALEIQELLTSWAEHLHTCQVIFLRTSTYSKQIFFGGKTPVLDKNDLRLRTIPFSTCRPTFNEVKRVHQMLTSVECYGEEADVVDFVPTSPPRHINRDSGQLEVRPDTPDRQSARARRNRDKPEADTVLNQNFEGQEVKEEEVAGEEHEDSDIEIELVETMVEMQTDELKEFDMSVPTSQGQGDKKKKKTKKKNKRKNDHGDSAAQSDLSESDAAEVELKNLLYTACKCGDLNLLSRVLSELHPDPSPQNPTGSSDSKTLPQVTSESSPVFPKVPSIHLRGGHCGDKWAGDRATDPVKYSETDISGSQNLVGQQHLMTTLETNKNGDSDVSDKKVWEHERSVIQDSANTDSEVTRVDQKVRKLCEALSQSSVMTDTGFNNADPINVRQNDTLTSGTLGESSSGESSNLVLHRLLNEVFGEKRSTLLHVASAGGHADIVHTLLAAGCDPTVRDAAGKLPYVIAASKETRNMFRRFRGIFPDLYNYDAAQIPEALTEQQEAEKKQREAERKKAQRKARQERLKEKKAEEAQAAAEQREKERFLALSDREKRALAAERRLIQQTASQGQTAPVVSRCFQCAVDMTGKVPFEYMEFRFCTTRCLREHRAKSTK